MLEEFLNADNMNLSPAYPLIAGKTNAFADGVSAGEIVLVRSVFAVYWSSIKKYPPWLPAYCHNKTSSFSRKVTWENN